LPNRKYDENEPNTMWKKICLLLPITLAVTVLTTFTTVNATITVVNMRNSQSVVQDDATPVLEETALPATTSSETSSSEEDTTSAVVDDPETSSDVPVDDSSSEDTTSFLSLDVDGKDTLSSDTSSLKEDTTSVDVDGIETRVDDKETRVDDTEDHVEENDIFSDDFLVLLDDEETTEEGKPVYLEAASAEVFKKMGVSVTVTGADVCNGSPALSSPFVVMTLVNDRFGSTETSFIGQTPTVPHNLHPRFTTGNVYDGSIWMKTKMQKVLRVYIEVWDQGNGNQRCLGKGYGPAIDYHKYTSYYTADLCDESICGCSMVYYTITTSKWDPVSTYDFSWITDYVTSSGEPCTEGDAGCKGKKKTEATPLSKRVGKGKAL